MEGLPRGHTGLREQEGILQGERERQLREFKTSDTAVALLSALGCPSNCGQEHRLVLHPKPAFHIQSKEGGSLCLSVLMCSCLCSSPCSLVFS